MFRATWILSESRGYIPGQFEDFTVTVQAKKTCSSSKDSPQCKGHNLAHWTFSDLPT
ncbi:hypothetical protein BT63DRAFT_423774 [Microthyrium microscopicum]|uniref:Uncharacterized protein n=1 Tax=Microthyrium microscopicum TaxID=703497 RepID=A0A6A6UFW8_9PEZI|nr:hypothetical protein BT63DRAFT_423774 [Microthyrium microscopicum]